MAHAAPMPERPPRRARGYSALSLVGHALSGRPWEPAWSDREPRSSYDVVVIGGGGHGLATAYHLAKDHGAKVALLERGWIGGGNTGRNTTVVRSNYYYPESAAFYDLSLKLYERLSEELNFNVMFSQHGVVNVLQSRHQLELARRSMNALLLNGIDDCALIDAAELRRRVPLLAQEGTARFPALGAMVQSRAGTVRHDAVAWGYARAADRRGVDIVQNCEVTGFHQAGGKITAVRTGRGDIACGRVALATAGHTSHLAAKAGVRLPIVSYALQAFVSEPVKPVLDCTVIANDTGVYVSQSEKGEIVVGHGLDLYRSYAQRGNIPVIEGAVAALLDLFPAFSRLRLMRQWAGVVDVTPDSSPIIGKTPVDNLYVNCGFGTGGFKAIPAGGVTYAATVANDRPHPLVEGFQLERFYTGDLIDEAGAAGIAH